MAFFFLSSTPFHPNPSMSSSSRRASGHSRSGIRGNEVSSRGGTPRNWNIVNGEDSTADCRNNPNPTPELMQNTPPESRSGNTNRRPSDGRQLEHRDRTNSTERDGSEDPGNRKCKLNEVIAKAISSASPFKRINSGYVLFGFDISTDAPPFTTTGRALSWMSMPFIAEHACSLSSSGQL